MNPAHFVSLGLTILLIFTSTTRVRSDDALRLTENCQVVFSSVEEGQALLIADDDFTRSLSRFDLQVRLQTNREVSLDDWKRFAVKQVQSWPPADRAKVAAGWQSLAKRLEKIATPLPPRVYVVATTGVEEANAAYCRGPAIFLPGAMRQGDALRLETLLAHELFHVISNQNPKLRAALYPIVGFEQVTPLEIHASLKERRLTNPDAPAIDCLMEVRDANRVYYAAPVLYASAPRYDATKKKSLFEYMEFRLMVVQRDKQQRWIPSDNEGRAVVIDPKKSPDFQQKIGANTKYTIHPEEILADNFAILAMEQKNVPSPQIIDSLRQVLDAASREQQ